MHFGITSNPYHDTAGIQHYFKYNLYPWLEKFTNPVGAVHVVRSDGCSGQMKSGRHFSSNVNVPFLRLFSAAPDIYSDP